MKIWKHDVIQTDDISFQIWTWCLACCMDHIQFLACLGWSELYALTENMINVWVECDPNGKLKTKIFCVCCDTRVPKYRWYCRRWSCRFLQTRDHVSIVGVYKALPGKSKGSVSGVFRLVQLWPSPKLASTYLISKVWRGFVLLCM